LKTTIGEFLRATRKRSSLSRVAYLDQAARLSLPLASRDDDLKAKVSRSWHCSGIPDPGKGFMHPLALGDVLDHGQREKKLSLLIADHGSRHIDPDDFAVLSQVLFGHLVERHFTLEELLRESPPRPAGPLDG